MRSCATVEDDPEAGLRQGHLGRRPQNDLISFTVPERSVRPRAARPIRRWSNNRDRVREQGGNNYSVTYSRVWNSLLIDGAFNNHDAEITDFAVVQTNAQHHRVPDGTDVRTLADEQLGGYGQDFPETRPTLQACSVGAVPVEGAPHQGRLRVGAAQGHPRPAVPARERSLAVHVDRERIYGERVGRAASRTARLVDAPVQRDQRERLQRFDRQDQHAAEPRAFYSRTTRTATARSPQTELGNVAALQQHRRQPERRRSTTTASSQSATGLQDQKVRGNGVLRAGRVHVRTAWPSTSACAPSSWNHFSTTGFSIFKFDWTLAPRLSAAYDLTGDGSQKAVGVLGPLLRPDPHGHDQLRGHDQRLDP